METCDECGYEYDPATYGQITSRVSAAAWAAADELRTHPTGATQRQVADRWSALEYGAHIRDVLLTIRDRMVIGLVEDNPDFKPMYRDERFTLGLCRADTAGEVALELEAAAAMFGRLFDAIDPSGLDRPVRYGFPNPVPRTVLWMGLQAVHEAEHHLADLRANLTRTS